MKIKTHHITALALILLVARTNAQSMDLEIKQTTDSLAKSIVAKGRKKIAAIDFTDLQARPTELGRFLAEQISVELVGKSEVSVVDRANLKNILAEHKLTEEGLVNPENAKKLGQLAGVDAIVTGTVISLDDSVVVTVKAIATDTAEIIAAGKTKFSKTSEINQLLTRSVATASPSGSTVAGNGTRYEELTDSIVTKDFSNLRIALKTVRPVKTSPQGFLCAFELTNRDLAKPLLLAINSDANRQLRTQLVDASGQVWKPYNNEEDLRGIGFVHGKHPLNDSQYILRALRETGVEGAMTTVQPGQSQRVTITFRAYSNQVTDPLQLECEFVVGVTESEQTTTYSLVNLMLDKIKLPK